MEFQIRLALLLISQLIMTTALDIVDWRNQTTFWNARTGGVQALVLHHTVTPTAQGTLDTLNRRRLSVHYIAEKNGTIYQMVDEANRAWHAGTGVWGSFVDLNDVSVGIEIVNSGAEPFPEVQEKAVAALSKVIVGKYKILPKNIVSHADFRPADKEDVSGYFDYKLFYSELGIYPGLYSTNLSAADQSQVLYQLNFTNNEGVKQIQQQLRQYGYYLEVDGVFGSQSQFAAEAFNRHYCPEVFIKETVDANDTMIRSPLNKRWYAISKERLSYLVAHGEDGGGSSNVSYSMRYSLINYITIFLAYIALVSRQ